jgi:hypothetical protein
MTVVGRSPSYCALLQLAKDVIAGVQAQAAANHAGLLTPWVSADAGGDADDYETGPAAYMRGLV